MNKKGFAVSSIIYSILILFLLLTLGTLSILGGRKIVLDKMKNEVIGNLNDEQVTNVYKDDSGANYPRLVDNMIPVIYDETKEKWVYADIYEKWYDYDEKMWANAVILKNNVIKTVGQEIEEEEIALMYVWIPRYKYTIFNVDGEAIEEQEIQITFETGINTTGTVKCVDAINQTDENGNPISEICTDTSNGTIVNNISTYTHPAFTFGEDEIEGFWVGKFENSTTDNECLNEPTSENCNKDSHIIEIKPNSDSLKYINIYNMFTSIKNIENNYNINNADSHVIKNMEWGAIAYLTQSKYGRCINGVCEQVTTNNVLKNTENYIMQTGCAANEISGSVSATCQNEYNTLAGLKASTTGNIYGVYDTVGGANEIVMSNMVDYYGSSLVSEVENKYIDFYSYDTNYLTSSRGKLGDSTKEVLKKINDNYGSWYDSKSAFASQGNSWFVRGGDSTDYDNSSIFRFSHSDGNGIYYVSSRSIIIK